MVLVKVPRSICFLVHACATRGGGRSKAGHCFHLLFSSFFSAFYFSPTSGNLPCVKICFLQYFGITRRYIPKKIGNFYFYYCYCFILYHFEVVVNKAMFVPTWILRMNKAMIKLYRPKCLPDSFYWKACPGTSTKHKSKGEALGKSVSLNLVYTV